MQQDKSLKKSILIYGPPGSGKGTVSKFLNVSDKIFHVSTGDIFRSIDPHCEDGKKIKNYLDEGRLIPDDFTVDVWYSFIQKKIKNKEYDPQSQYLLLDGIPRTLKQAILLEKYISIEYIIVLDVKNIKILIDRMKKRADLENRSDDTDENVLKNRINIYLNDTLKLLSHYPKNKIFSFNGDQEKLQVIRDILIEFAGKL